MAKGLFTVDNILLFGIIGGGAAYFLDLGGFKATVDQAIADLMNALKLGGGGGGCDPTVDPTCGGGGGLQCSDPTCTSECCRCKCQDRVNCPEGVCCDKCRNECPAQCGSSGNLTGYVPDNEDGSLYWGMGIGAFRGRARR